MCELWFTKKLKFLGIKNESVGQNYVNNYDSRKKTCEIGSHNLGSPLIFLKFAQKYEWTKINSIRIMWTKFTNFSRETVNQSSSTSIIVYRPKHYVSIINIARLVFFRISLFLDAQIKMILFIYFSRPIPSSTRWQSTSWSWHYTILNSPAWIPPTWLHALYACRLEF